MLRHQSCVVTDSSDYLTLEHVGMPPPHPLPLFHFKQGFLRSQLR